MKIQRSAAEITGLFKQCERQMKALAAENRLPGHTGEASDDIVRKNILATSATQLQELHFQFRRQQKTYLSSTSRHGLAAHMASAGAGRRYLPSRSPCYPARLPSLLFLPLRRLAGPKGR